MAKLVGMVGRASRASQPESGVAEPRDAEAPVHTRLSVPPPAPKLTTAAPPHADTQNRRMGIDTALGRVKRDTSVKLRKFNPAR